MRWKMILAWLFSGAAFWKRTRPGVAPTCEIGLGVRADSSVVIGGHSYVGPFTSLTKCRVGRYCSIGENVLVGPGQHELSSVSTSSLFYEDPWAALTGGECLLEHDVWIGSHSIIMRGIKVGTGAVVGANSVVTKDVPPYAVVAGSPARVLRMRFSDDIIALLLASRWWEQDLPSAKRELKNLRAVMSDMGPTQMDEPR